MEGANGGYGFYVVSDSGSNAYRVRVRPPCFTISSRRFQELLIGDMIADLHPHLPVVNMIGGELDR